jgi:hypothetical protein
LKTVRASLKNPVKRAPRLPERSKNSSLRLSELWAIYQHWKIPAAAGRDWITIQSMSILQLTGLNCMGSIA